MPNLSPPLRWYGGKYYMADRLAGIIADIPHITYVEPYGGAASVLLNKKRSPVEVWNDIDGRLVNFFRVLRESELRERLLEALTLTPYARGEFAACCDAQPTDDPVENARQFFVLCQQSTSSTGCQKRLTLGYWAKSVTVSRRGMAQNVSRWWGNVAGLTEIADRLAGVLIEGMDALKVIEQYDTPNTLFYCDPPYIGISRSVGKDSVYANEMDEKAHIALLDRLCTVRGSVLLSGYDSPLYTERLAGWESVRIPSKARSSVQATTRSKSGSVPDRTETVWVRRAACCSGRVSSLVVSECTSLGEDCSGSSEDGRAGTSSAS